MRWVITLLCGGVAGLVAANVEALFGVRNGIIALILVAPAIEEACKAISCVFARRKAIVPAPWTFNDALGLGLGFGILEAVVKWSPGPSIVDAVQRLPTVVMHGFVALLLVAEINKATETNKNNAERGFVAALFWHALYNAYILVAAEIGLIGGWMESVVRLAVMVALVSFTAPMLRRQSPD